MKKLRILLLSVACAMALLLAITPSALAFSSKQMYRQEVSSASAVWIEETPVYTEFKLNVAKTDDETDVYVYEYTNSGGVITLLTGHLYTTDEIFNIDHKLTHAALSAVPVDLYEKSTSAPIKTITIEAEWTGIGEVTRSSDRSQDKSGDFMAKYSSTFLRRQADVTGSLDGQNLGPADSGTIVRFRQANMRMDK